MNPIACISVKEDEIAGQFLYRKIVRRLLQINDTPESIALGASVGMFIAMTPTVGLQMLIMIIVGTVIRANRLAGCVMVYISNPFTLIPIYWLDYWVGSKVLGLELVSRQRFTQQLESYLASIDSEKLAHGFFVGLWNATTEFFEVQWDSIVWPSLVGGSLLGLVCAIPVYPLTLRGLRAHQRRRAHRQSLARLRDVLREERVRGTTEEPTGSV